MGLPDFTTSEASLMSAHIARCFCGAVEVKLSGDSAGMGYCHCDSCRRWSAGPVNAFTLWPTASVKITRGEDRLGVYAGSANSRRRWCTKCGGHVLTEHPGWGLVDVYAAVIEDFDFKPGVHVNYQETVLPMADGLPKQKDFPEALGGTGSVIAE